jgi:dihydrofolate synthase / folylpolyglutamate synthase
MKFIKIKTPPILPPKNNIYPLLDKYLGTPKEGDVVFITSKILAIHQGRCIKITPEVNKDYLVIKESERYIPRDNVPNKNFLLTIKEHTLIPTAGIDESNGNGYYILWPKKPNALAKEICIYLRNKFKIKNLAIIITDSHTIPLRYGVIGISIGLFGLEPLYDYKNKKDIFGRKLKFTKTNLPDALSAMAVLLMGEGDEQTPMIILRGAKFIRFTDKDSHNKLVIPFDKDIYSPLLSVFNKKDNYKEKKKTPHKQQKG